jgi:putative transport protein
VTDYKNQFQTLRQKLESVEISITNPNLFGQKLSYIKEFIDKELVISRIKRDETYLVATENLELREGDVIIGVSALQYIRNLKMKIGKVKIAEKKEISGDLAMFHVLVTNRKYAGKTIQQMNLVIRLELWASASSCRKSGMNLAIQWKSSPIPIQCPYLLALPWA